MKNPDDRESVTPKSQRLTIFGNVLSNVTQSISEERAKKEKKTRVSDSKESVTHESKGFWIKLFLRATYIDVEQIIAKWTSEKKASVRVATAIRIYDAVMQGDIELARQIDPMFISAIQNAKKVRKNNFTPPLIESDSVIKGENEEEEEIEEVGFFNLLEAIRKVTGSDWRVNSKVSFEARRLVKAGYQAEHVYMFGLWFSENDWRGRDKQERPTFKDLLSRIGIIAKTDTVDPNLGQIWVSKVDAPENLYLSDPYFKNREIEID